MSRRQTEAMFDHAMREVYRRAKEEAGYNATYFLRMLDEHGGVDTARRLLREPSVSDGFTALWAAGRLDLTVETQVLRPEFQALFNRRERLIAERRLEDPGQA